jgi:cell division protein FtsN
MRFQDVRFKGLGTGLLGAGLLGLLLGTCGVMTAQDGHDEAKPQQQEEPKQDEAKPPRQQNEPRDAKPSREQEQPKAQEAKPSNNQKQDEKQNGEMRSGKEQDHAAQNNGAARASEQRGQRIPDDKFRSNFGRQHTFRVRTQVVEGQPRFQYSGYWFALATPWPGDWDYADDCYVDYIDGEYVLIDLRHPGVQLALIVVD